MSEADEIARTMATRAPQFTTFDHARMYVRGLMVGEGMTMIDNVAWSLWCAGHGRGSVATKYAKSWFRGSDYKTGTMDERCANCGAPFNAHYNGQCPADEE